MPGPGPQGRGRRAAPARVAGDYRPGAHAVSASALPCAFRAEASRPRPPLSPRFGVGFESQMVEGSVRPSSEGR
jgi:hypothetical protein